MELSQLHIDQPLWLWGCLVIPLVWIVFFFFQSAYRSNKNLEKFIDHHLLPYLLVDNLDRKSKKWSMLLVWSIIWLCLIIALAGPRWNFREMEMFSRDQSLIILLDLSESMNATDIKPSRLSRAKQKIEDLINLSKGVKIGLIAFAADPHLITPLTDDKETLRHLLPSLETDLAYVQGSRLSSALNMASNMLETEIGNNKALLVISDGGFEDASAMTTAKAVAAKNINIHVMGIGTLEGAPLKDHKGKMISKNGTAILSKLDQERLREISKVGRGHYLEGHYTDHAEAIILKELEQSADAQQNIGKTNRFWEEGFYLFILPTLPFILWWFNRGSIFASIIFLAAMTSHLEGASLSDYFLNSEQFAKAALENCDYQTSVEAFHDPYRKGVANYKAGNFAEAEQNFRQSSRPEVASSASYNLGNALAHQQKFQEAIAAYEDVLTHWPDHVHAKENLELIKKILEEQKDKNSSDSNSNEDKKEDSGEQNSENKEQEDSQNQNNPPGQEENKNDQHSEGSQEQNFDESSSGEQERTEEEKDVRPEAPQRSQEDLDADLWLNHITNDPKQYLKNKFYLESKRNGTREGIDPW